MGRVLAHLLKKVNRGRILFAWDSIDLIPQDSHKTIEDDAMLTDQTGGANHMWYGR
jgi:hypothetical protein